jgi:hypothetical protein
LTVYADTSFLVSLYVLDTHSVAARRGLSSRPRLWVTPLHRAELAHAVEGLAFQDSISRQIADEVYKDFKTDLEDGVWAQVDIPDLAFEICAQLARRPQHAWETARLIRYTSQAHLN